MEGRVTIKKLTRRPKRRGCLELKTIGLNYLGLCGVLGNLRLSRTKDCM